MGMPCFRERFSFTIRSQPANFAAGKDSSRPTNRIVFQMKNYGDISGYKTEDILEPYTVYLYK